MVRLYTIPEAASYFQVSVAAIRKWILEKRLGYTKVGRLVRIPEDALKAFSNQV